METNDNDSSSGQIQDISSTAKKIVDEIKNLEKELVEIQESCSHPKYTVKNSQISGDSGFCLRKVCDECRAIIGYPSQEEINRWTNS
jgi:hypothetical protein